MAITSNFPGGEDVTAEVQAQTPVVADIIENLVGKATGANATAEDIRQGKTAYVGQELVTGTLDVGGISYFTEGIKVATLKSPVGRILDVGFPIKNAMVITKPRAFPYFDSIVFNGKLYRSRSSNGTLNGNYLELSENPINGSKLTLNAWTQDLYDNTIQYMAWG